MRPYKDLEVTDKYIIREFDENIDPIELMWHRDNEDRTIEIIGETNWQIQLDNELPTSLNKPSASFLLKSSLNPFLFNSATMRFAF